MKKNTENKTNKNYEYFLSYSLVFKTRNNLYTNKNEKIIFVLIIRYKELHRYKLIEFSVRFRNLKTDLI